MAIEEVATFIDAVERSQLLDVEQIRALSADGTEQFKHAKELAKDLVLRGLLTRYQAKQLLLGNGEQLTLGSYRILERLGEGGMGQVYKALHVPMNRLVALKIVKPDLVADARTLKRFHREVRAAAQLSHPNIVTVFDANQIGNVHFLAMEYIDGVDLAALVRDSGPMSVVAAADAMRQAALGLHHAHERGIIHRDIKPSNLLLTRTDPAAVLKILDMGLARPAQIAGSENQSSLTIDGTVVGTPDFMSPEQAKNSKQVDFRSDFYSLGCTLYYVLAGRLPFQAKSVMEKLIQHQLEQPYPIELLRNDIPAGLIAILQRMMAKKPEERFGSGEELAAALAQFCTAQAPPPPTMSVPVQPVAEVTESIAGPLTQPGGGSSTFRFEDSQAMPAVVRPGPRVSPRPNRPPFALVAIIGGVAMLLALGILLGLALRAGTSTTPTTSVKEAVVPAVTSRPKVPEPDQIRPPSTAEEWLAAGLQERSVFAFVVNLEEIFKAPMYQKHFQPILQPAYELLAPHDIVPERQWQRLLISIDPDGKDRVLSVLHSGTSLRGLAKALSAAGQPMALNIDESVTHPGIKIIDAKTKKETLVSFVGDLDVLISNDPSSLREGVLRFLGKKKNATNDFIVQLLNKTNPASAVRLAVLGRFALKDETLEESGVRNLSGELAFHEDIVFNGRARVQEYDAFAKKWREVGNSLTRTAFFEPPMLLPGAIISRAGLLPAANREGGQIEVQIASRLRPNETERMLRVIADYLKPKIPKADG